MNRPNDLMKPGPAQPWEPASAQRHRQLAVLFAAYPIETRNVPADDALATAQVYARALEDLSERETDEAILTLVRTSPRLPTVAAIRQAVLVVRYGPPRPGLDAWGDVQRAMRKHGARHAPGKDFRFDDPLVAHAVERLGWSELCRSENPAADHAHFAKLYEALRDQERARTIASAGMISTLLARAPSLVDETPAQKPRVDVTLPSQHGYQRPGDPHDEACLLCGEPPGVHRPAGGGR